MVQRSIDGIIPSKPDDMVTKKTPKASRLYKRSLISLGVLVLIVGLSFGAISIYRYFFVAPDPIPLTIRKTVDFTVYYPNSKKLPVSYVINKSSISSTNDVLVFSIDYGDGKQIIITEQPLPSANALQAFYAQRIPLRNNLTTPVGQAAISALNGETFVSLPANKTWVIITAPANINQTELRQILSSIKQA